MKTYSALTALVVLLGVLTVLRAEEKTQAINPNDIQEKVIVTLGEEFAIEFNRDGDQLTNPAKSKQAEVQKLAVNVKLAVTSASPAPPPREGATRPYLSVENNLNKTMHFRAIVRRKGSKEYFAIAEGAERVAAGSTMYKCWDFDTLVEEVILYDFKLSDQPAE